MSHLDRTVLKYTARAQTGRADQAYIAWYPAPQCGNWLVKTGQDCAPGRLRQQEARVHAACTQNHVLVHACLLLSQSSWCTRACGMYPESCTRALHSSWPEAHPLSCRALPRTIIRSAASNVLSLPSQARPTFSCLCGFAAREAAREAAEGPGADRASKTSVN